MLSIKLDYRMFIHNPKNVGRYKLMILICLFKKSLSQNVNKKLINYIRNTYI